MSETMTHDTVTMRDLDFRYTVNREGIGKAAPKWVVRFCGDWLTIKSEQIMNGFDTEQEALRAAIEHNKQRMEAYQ